MQRPVIRFVSTSVIAEGRLAGVAVLLRELSLQEHCRERRPSRA
jgi:hypothetical protein